MKYRLADIGLFGVWINKMSERRNQRFKDTLYKKQINAELRQKHRSWMLGNKAGV